ncbi:hypothetical protein C8J57DRAFT_567018 [Mycena rebaudengoi]|nr:hypothetical protein C8J57DRAFT_567018 [Mycena rebaudengoi]
MSAVVPVVVVVRCLAVALVVHIRAPFLVLRERGAKSSLHPPRHVWRGGSGCALRGAGGARVARDALGAAEPAAALTSDFVGAGVWITEEKSDLPESVGGICDVPAMGVVVACRDLIRLVILPLVLVRLIHPGVVLSVSGSTGRLAVLEPKCDASTKAEREIVYRRHTN